VDFQKLSSLGRDELKDVLKFIESESGTRVTELFTKALGMTDQIRSISGDDFLVPGQLVCIKGTWMTIIQHVDAAPGYYTAFPESNDISDVHVIPTYVVYHPPTAEWIKRLRSNPKVELASLIRRILEKVGD
jgi:hypothetical protein